MKTFLSGIITGVTAFGLIGGLWLWQPWNRMDGMTVTNSMSGMAGMSEAMPGERTPLYWVAPMDPNYRRSEPGLSPMGMALIPVYESGDTITVAASIQQNLGVRTAVALSEDFAPTVEAVGTTNWDESSILVLHTRARGWLEVFKLASVGDRIAAGEVMYELFAPDLQSAQREFLIARDSGNRQLTETARDRLLVLGFSNAQVDELDRSSSVGNRLVVRADSDAVITRIGARPGAYVEPATPLATLASLDRVWVETEIFESKALWIEAGLPATVSFSAFPGESWDASIAYVYPDLDPVTRSLRVRLIVENADHRLRPNMFASVRILARPRPDVVSIPREAVIRSGVGERVILALGEGRFQPQVVRTGISSDSRIEIRSGLAAGDTVVTSGQFLLDSEANGEQAFARLLDSDSDPDTQPVTTAIPMTGNTVEIPSPGDRQ